MKSKKMVALVLAMAVIASIIAGCNGNTAQNTGSKVVVAVVGGENISKDEFDKMYEVFKTQYEQQYGANVWDQEVDGKKFGDVAKEKVLDAMIDNKLQLKNAADINIKVTDEEINTEIVNVKNYFDSEDKFNEFLKIRR